MSVQVRIPTILRKHTGGALHLPGAGAGGAHRRPSSSPSTASTAGINAGAGLITYRATKAADETHHSRSGGEDAPNRRNEFARTASTRPPAVTSFLSSRLKR